MPLEEKTSPLQSRLLPAAQKVPRETEYVTLHCVMGNLDVIGGWTKTMQSVPSFKAVFIIIREEKKDKTHRRD